MWCESKASRLTGNILDIQIGTSASAFISGSATKLTVKNNAATGSTIVSGSHVVVFGGLISATDNEMFVDNGSRVTLIQSTVTGNTAKDLLLTFGSRADLTGNTIGVASCDSSTLIRGDSGITCPR